MLDDLGPMLNGWAIEVYYAQYIQWINMVRHAVLFSVYQRYHGVRVGCNMWTEIHTSSIHIIFTE
jgi:hypothetical protein